MIMHMKTKMRSGDGRLQLHVNGGLLLTRRSETRAGAGIVRTASAATPLSRPPAGTPPGPCDLQGVLGSGPCTPAGWDTH